MSIAIKVENLSKAYQLGEIGTGTLSRDLERWFAKIRGKEDPFLKIGETNDRTSKGTSDIVWSLKDINFEIEQGDAVGIIGRNGAGKSTLLKILSRVTSPTTGKISGKGRIASLLEVGTGFHPELTGRENIFLNGAILGMRKKEIQRKFDEIVDFAGVERYVDTPVKRYSSGMYVRLAFAVAAHLDSEILIVDEVLAVGDAEFQKKCMGKMGEVSKGEGRTVLFVSHNMGSVSLLCKSAILLKEGSMQMFDTVDTVIDHYLKAMHSHKMEVSFKENLKLKGQFLFAKLINEDSITSNSFPQGKNPKLEIEYVIRNKVSNFHIAMVLTDSIGNQIYSSADTDLDPELLGTREAGTYKVCVNVEVSNFNVGSYNLALGMGIIGVEIFHRVDVFNFNIIDIGCFGTGKELSGRKGLLLVQAKWNY